MVAAWLSVEVAAVLLIIDVGAEEVVVTATVPLPLQAGIIEVAWLHVEGMVGNKRHSTVAVARLPAVSGLRRHAQVAVTRWCHENESG